MNYSVIRIAATLSLFLAVLELPYAYYIFLRFFVCGVTIYGSSLAGEQNKQIWFWIMAVLAVLFNPILPIYMEKEAWVVFDIVAGIFIFGSILFLKENNKV